MRTLATGGARRSRTERAGFTLVELMMTVAIIAMAAAAVVMVAADPRPAVGAEAERFAARLTSARDEAVLTNRSIAVETTASGYDFQAFDGQVWTALQEGPFKPVVWETGTSVPADQEAQRLFTTQQQAFVNLRRGRPDLVPPPLAAGESMAAYCTSEEQYGVDRALACAVIGAPGTVRAGVAAFLARHQPDELLLTANIFDHAARVRSFELAMEACADRAIG